jgi:AcrR family transcriptional regulator
MRARAEAAAATQNRILQSARQLLFQHPFDDITIDRVAADAGTTTRTVLRLYGSKEELFAEALHTLGELGQAPITPGDIAALIRGMFDFYEQVGDTVVRWTADGPRLPAMRKHLSIGREHLRSWVGAAFAADLVQRQGADRKRLHDALIVAFDVHTWKLLRRDLGLARAAAEATIAHLVRGILAHPYGKNTVVKLVGRRKPAA